MKNGAELRRPLLRSGLIACLLTAARPGAAGAEPCPVPDTTRVVRTVREVMARERIPGLVVGFTLDTCTWVRAFGTADVENETPMAPRSSFRLASVQKTMTAVAVLQLAERGQLDLDAPIQRYVPYFPRKPWPVTARLLLSHLGGIPHYVNRDVEQHIREHRSTRQAIEIFAGFDLIAEPGTRYFYSSYGYNLLGAAIEGASGLSYAEYMRTHVWAPAGMVDTRMDDPRGIIPRRVRGYQLVGDTLRNSEFIDVSSRFAAGGTRGTVPDLLRFMAALDGGRLLRDSTRTEMIRPANTRDGHAIPYAMGWQIPPFRDRGSVVTNDGGQQETRTFILDDPDHRVRIALAMNLEADVYGPIVVELYRSLTGRTLVVER